MYKIFKRNVLQIYKQQSFKRRFDELVIMKEESLAIKSRELYLVCSKDQEKTRKYINRFERKDVEPRLNKVRIKIPHLPKDKFCQVLQRISITARFITDLQLQGNQLTSSSIQLIAKTGLKFICKLNLSKTCLSDTAVGQMRLLTFGFLKDVDLSFNPIKNKGVNDFCRCSFPSLQRLYLKKINATSSCFGSIAKAHWPKLKELNFAGTLLGVIDLSFLQLLRWSSCCLLNLSSNDSSPVFGWSGSLAKVPSNMAELKVILCSNHTRLNSEAIIQNLYQIYPNADKLFYVWKTKYNNVSLVRHPPPHN